MIEFFSKLLDTSDFPARWHCGRWTAAHGWLHVISDLAVWGAYTAIPCVLIFFILRRKDAPFPRVFWLFGAFILACGSGHLVEASIFWWPAYRLSGLVKLLTAIVSWATVLVLIRVWPDALKLPGLAKINAELEAQIRQRVRIEQSLREKADELERRNEEMERFNRVAVGREQRMMELKQEINELLARSREPPRYRMSQSVPQQAVHA